MGIFSSSSHAEMQEAKSQQDKIEESKINTIDQNVVTNGSVTDKVPEQGIGEVPKDSVVRSGENAGKPVEVVINGPLGHVYTQALNLLLGKEDMAGTSMVSMDESDHSEDSGMYVVTTGTPEVDETDKAYVYVTDASGIDLNEMNRVLDDIDAFVNKNPDAQVVVGLENARHASKVADKLIQHLSLGKAHISINKCATLQHLQGWVNSHQK